MIVYSFGQTEFDLPVDGSALVVTNICTGFGSNQLIMKGLPQVFKGKNSRAEVYKDIRLK